MHNQVNRCLSVKTCASNASSILVLIPCPILSCVAIAHTIMSLWKMRDQLPSYFSQEGEKSIHRRGLRYHLNKKGKEGMEFRQIPSLSFHPSIYHKRKHCRCLSQDCTRRNHTARRKGGTWVQSGNARLRNLDCIPNRSEKNKMKNSCISYVSMNIHSSRLTDHNGI